MSKQSLKIPIDELKKEFYWCENSKALKRKTSIQGQARNSLIGCRKSDGRKSVGFKSKEYLYSRVVWTWFNGEIPEGMIVDHINQDPSDDRLENLRLVTKSGNSRNTKRPIDNTSGIIGVSYNTARDKWEAYINIKGKRKRLYYGVSKAKAAVIRKAAEYIYGFHANHGSIRTN